MSSPALPSSPLPPAEQSAALARHVVSVTAAYTGRGPNKAKAHLSGDLVVVVLQDTLTKAERALVRDGEEKMVVAMRRAFQSTMRNDLIAGVEAITGRSVFAFLSDHSTDPDIAIETFMLHPTTAPTTQSST